MINEHKLRHWLTQKLQQEESFEKVTLVHMSEFGPELVSSWPIQAVDNLDVLVITLGEAIKESANENLEAYDGQQRYHVRALDGQDQELATHVFKLDGGHDGSLVEMGSNELFQPGQEPPTEKGLMAQLMRHLETKDRALTNIMGVTIDGLISENKSLRANQEINDARRVEVFDRLENAKSQEHEREQDALEQEAMRVMKKQALEKALAYAPAIIGHLSQGKGPLADAAKTAQDTQQPQQSSSVNGYTVTQYQDWLRDVVKVIGGIARLKEAYDDEHHDTINDLLGVGTDPENVEDFREKFNVYIEALPAELHADLATNLSQ